MRFKPPHPGEHLKYLLFGSRTDNVSGISEQKCVQRSKSRDVSVVTGKRYVFSQPGERQLEHRPVIIGTGPAGLFCGYLLAVHGYRPILLERGQAVEQRCRDVETFWNGGGLDPESLSLIHI